MIDVLEYDDDRKSEHRKYLKNVVYTSEMRLNKTL